MKHILFLILVVLLANVYAMAQKKTFELFPPSKKDIGFTLSLPYLNSMKYHNYLTGKHSTKGGFVGIGAALYYRQNDVKFSLNATAMASTPAPFPTFHWRKDGIHTSITNWGFDAMMHYPVHQYIHIVGGINYMKMHYNRTSYEPGIRDLYTTDASIGITTGVEIKLFYKEINLGIFYRPSVISIGEKFSRHVISLDARFDIPVWFSPKPPKRVRKKR